jgi:hypothetical protein
LLTAVVGLKIEYKRKPGSLEKAIDRVLEKEEKELRKKLRRPDVSIDTLYRSDFVYSVNTKIPCREIYSINFRNLIL